MTTDDVTIWTRIASRWLVTYARETGDYVGAIDSIESLLLGRPFPMRPLHQAGVVLRYDPRARTLTVLDLAADERHTCYNISPHEAEARLTKDEYDGTT